MKVLANNKKANYDYEILEKYEAGISLVGAEVKSIKSGKISIKDSFISISEKNLFLKGSQVVIPKHITMDRPDEKRDRQLLLNKSEIKELKKEVERKGLTIVPLKIYLNNKGFVKLEIALVKGKKNYDKRETIKKRDQERQVKRDLKNY
jgi:SsrA-binding protein